MAGPTPQRTSFSGGIYYVLYKISGIVPRFHSSQLKSFLITLCVVISVFIAFIFIFLDNQTSRLMQQRVREQAIAYLDLINHTKKWNFDYGGVYVVKKNGVSSNGYLENLGLNPDISGSDGRILTIRNHAIMASEISRRSEKADGVKFRIISRKPLAPVNAPADSFERTGLDRLGSASVEYTQMIDGGTPPMYRFMSPLFAEAGCLGCHRGTGLRPGDVLGAVSISIPIQDLINEKQHTRLIILLSAVSLISLLVAITYFLTFRLAVDLDTAQIQLKRMALTDELTGLNNRRQVMARLTEEFQRAVRREETLSIVSLDIDHFKRINDTHGHPVGDIVLKQVAQRLQASVRPYDTVGRVGGEEFIIIAPDTDSEEVKRLAERILQFIRQAPVTVESKKIPFSASAGIAVLQPDDATIDDILRRADRHLYEAKAAGRDRVAGP